MAKTVDPEMTTLILAGDIGGTKARLALFRTNERRCLPVRDELFSSRDYAGLEDVLQKFIPEKSGTIRCACFGVAGPVVGGRVRTTNLPWNVEAGRLRRKFRIPTVLLMNDLEAMAYGTRGLRARDLRTLNPGRPGPSGNRAVIAAGTGLGEAILYWDGADYKASASEGGHTDFGPRNPIEVELLEYLSKQFNHVSYERVVSGPGLFRIYQFLRDRRSSREPSWLTERLKREDPATVITETGSNGSHPLCVRALDLFVSLYGAEAGNLALKSMAAGGVYLGGGIAPKIINKLLDGSFMKAFTAKGRYAAMLGRIPVRVILNEKTGLLGAAQYGLDHLRNERKANSP
jgi:glucokinase